jgi:hypothetical protein
MPLARRHLPDDPRVAVVDRRPAFLVAVKQRDKAAHGVIMIIMATDKHQNKGDMIAYSYISALYQLRNGRPIYATYIQCIDEQQRA